MPAVQVPDRSARKVEVKEVPGRTLAVHRFRADVARIPEQMGEAFGLVFGFAGNHGLQISGPAVAHYTMAGPDFDVAAGFVVSEPFEGAEGIEPLTIPSAKVITVTHFGPYSGLPATYEWLRGQATELGYRLSDREMWEDYLNEPGAVPDDRLETAIYWPLVE